MPRRIQFFLGLCAFTWSLFHPAGQTSAALVLNDPLQGSTIGTRSGGGFVADGWQVTGQTDSIYWHVPTIPHGAAEFDVRGLYPNECRTGMEDKVELFHMYDFTFGNADVNYTGGYRDDPFKHFIRKTDCLDTARVNSMEIVWKILANYTEPDTAQVGWDPSVTYRFREEWGPDGAGNSVLKLYRNGTLLLTTSVAGAWNPAGHSVRIAASPRRAADFGAPVGAVFSNVKVWDLSSTDPGVARVTQPASNSVVNTPIVFLQWTGGLHTRYQARVTSVNDPDSAIVWDSGEVASDRNFAWTGWLADRTTNFVFVRLGEETGWGPWSASGWRFRVDTSATPAGRNVVRVNGKSFCDHQGPFLGLGVSYFQALRHAKFDRARLTSNLELLASKGFNYVRVLSMVNWPGLEIAPVNFTNRVGQAVTAWPDYFQQLRDLLDLVAQHGMRTELTIFADAQYVMPSKAARQAHLNGILATIAGREHELLHLEVANEAWQNGFPGSQGVTDLREFTRYLADRTAVPVAITSNDDTSDAGIVSLHSGSAADLATVHFSRDIRTVEGGWLPVRDTYRAGNLPGVPPVTSNEPIGPGSSVNAENDPMKLCAAAVFAYLANLPGYVYHSRAGVYGYVNCCPPGGGELPFENSAGINAYQFLRALLPGDLASWVRNDGLEPSAPFTVFCNGQPNRYWPDVTNPTNGCDRNIGAIKGREFISFPMGIYGGSVTLQARRPVQFRVLNPLTGIALSNVTLEAGSAVTLPRGSGAYLIKGTFRDLPTALVPQGAMWRYWDNGSNPGATWRAPAYNDQSWGSGSAQLGFGDGDEATIIDGGPATNRHVTTYFRRNFWVEDRTAVAQLALRLLRDDGALVYLNGVEVFRSNMPAGSISAATFAQSVVGGAEESTTYFGTNLNPNLLVSGTNHLAVEVHQVNATSSDLSFDLVLSAELVPPRLGVTLASNQVVLAWPLSAWDFHVQWASDLNQNLPAHWSDLPGLATVSNGQHRVSIMAGDPQQYFRLTDR